MAGKLSDRYGRKPIIRTGSITQLIVISLFAWVNSFYWMIFARFIYGFAYGFSHAIVLTYMSEIMPAEYRGKTIMLCVFMGSIGKMFGIMLGAIFLDSFTSGNWRAMMLASSIPNMFFLIWAMIWLYESPRYLIASYKLEDSFEILNSMMEKNRPEERISLSDEEK